MRKMFPLHAVFLIGIFVCVVRMAFGQDRKCSMTSDCQISECCLSPVVMNGKREIDGYCKPREDIGKLCYVKNDQLQAPESEVLYFDACPCRLTLECQGTGMIEVPQGEQGKCVATNATKKRAASCSNASDCAPDECCASFVQGEDRRYRRVGKCKKLLQEGDSCLVNIGREQGVNFECPCSAGFTCKGLRLFIEMPLGEKGQLVFLTDNTSVQKSGAHCSPW